MAALVAGALACRPLITVGWTELLILAGVIVFAISPFLFKVYRFFLRMEKEKEDESGGV